MQMILGMVFSSTIREHTIQVSEGLFTPLFLFLLTILFHFQLFPITPAEGLCGRQNNSPPRGPC